MTSSWDQLYADLVGSALRLGVELERKAVVAYLRRLDPSTPLSAVAAAVECDVHDSEREIAAWAWADFSSPGAGVQAPPTNVTNGTTPPTDTKGQRNAHRTR